MTAQLHELTLSGPAYGGDCLGHLEDGRTVFVSWGVPGERVLVELTQEKSDFARGRLAQVLAASPARREARCKHFGACGGCQYQHMSYAAQLRAKSEILREQLVRIGQFNNPPVGETVASPSEWNYRNRVQFHLTYDGRLAYVAARDRSQESRQLVPIQECHLPEEPIGKVWPKLAFDKSDEVRQAEMRLGSRDEILLALESDARVPGGPPLRAGVSVTQWKHGEPVVIDGQGHVTLRLLSRAFRVSANSFFQVNTPATELMVQHVLSHLPERIGTVVDVYCGVGLFSAFLAERSEAVVGVESSPGACDDFAFNLDEFDNVALYQDAAERALPALDLRADAAVVDPPRMGLKRAALDGIVRMQPSRLIYVSCNPSTLARDARILCAEGYQLQQVTPFDLFPQTYHIESVSVLVR